MDTKHYPRRSAPPSAAITVQRVGKRGTERVRHVARGPAPPNRGGQP